ncbi:cytochrome c family protein [Ideonella sp.]|uniref:c-type cytochrome n=1 Tax=Ideonella sp. TaxID=1929293 RepID=UPI0035B065DF
MDLVLTSTKTRAAARAGQRRRWAPALLASLGLFGLGLAWVPAQAAGDAKVGSAVFAEQCAECHSLKEGKNKKGPSIFAVIGRRPASVAGFNYSDAMKARTQPWTEANVSAYVEQPKVAVPGGTMKYDGLADAKAREDLIAFLLTVR